jgi:hypothetical protein
MLGKQKACSDGNSSGHPADLPHKRNTGEGQSCGGIGRIGLATRKAPRVMTFE